MEYVLYLASDRMGEGSEELGQLLIRSYLYTLTQADALPRTILLVNGGVRLALEESPVLGYLQELVQKGVTLLACGTCLDYFEAKERLAAGQVSNMYDIAEELARAPKVIRP